MSTQKVSGRLATVVAFSASAPTSGNASGQIGQVHGPARVADCLGWDPRKRNSKPPFEMGTQKMTLEEARALLKVPFDELSVSERAKLPLAIQKVPACELTDEQRRQREMLAWPEARRRQEQIHTDHIMAFESAGFA